jgi:hypothetical protein
MAQPDGSRPARLVVGQSFGADALNTQAASIHPRFSSTSDWRSSGNRGARPLRQPDHPLPGRHPRRPASVHQCFLERATRQSNLNVLPTLKLSLRKSA